jgi:hypothetical protein
MNLYAIRVVEPGIKAVIEYEEEEIIYVSKLTVREGLAHARTPLGAIPDSFAEDVQTAVSMTLGKRVVLKVREGQEQLSSLERHLGDVVFEISSNPG